MWKENIKAFIKTSEVTCLQYTINGKDGGRP